MFYFSQRSRIELQTLNPKLQLILTTALKAEVYDIAVLSGFRDKETQNLLYKIGQSELQWPDSDHNNMIDGMPFSNAMDIAFYPIDWNDIKKWHHFAGFIMGVGACLGHPLKWGGNFKTLRDYNHFALINP